MAIDEKETLTGDAALAKIRRLLKDLPIAFMVTVDGGGVLARPIGVVGGHGAFDGSLWFITDRRSRKVAAIQQGATTALPVPERSRRHVSASLRARRSRRGSRQTEGTVHASTAHVVSGRRR